MRKNANNGKPIEINRLFLEVDSEKFDRMCCACQSALPDCGDGEVLFDEEVTFANGNRMVIQVIASGNEDESAWTQGVLFSEEGQELSSTEVGERFDGEYCAPFDGIDYIVDVVRKSAYKYAPVVWTTGDVISLRPSMTESEAEEFLSDNEGAIQDRMVEAGWEVIECLLPAKTAADEDEENDD